MKTYEFVTHESESHPGRILVAARNCACAAFVGTFSPCHLHASNAELEGEFLKKADEEQKNYDKGILPRSARSSDAYEDPPKAQPLNESVIGSGKDPWDGE